jgi:hypothetical protein
LRLKARNTGRIARKALSMVLAGLFSLAVPANAADLKPETTAAYNRYLQLTEANIDAELARGNPYLWIDAAPESRRAAAYAELRKGNLVIERLETLDHGKTIAVPGGLLHHWIGTVFIPGASLAQTLEFMEDYNHKQDYFRPDIQRSSSL